MLGFARLWLTIAVAMSVSAVRHGMGFALTWWGYTFPVGTCVTGAEALLFRTGTNALGVLSVALCVLLFAAWAAAAANTLRGLVRGTLSAP